MRSRSSWKAGRSSSGGSGRLRPRERAERAARGWRVRSSRSSSISRMVPATLTFDLPGRPAAGAAPAGFPDLYRRPPGLSSVEARLERGDEEVRQGVQHHRRGDVAGALAEPPEEEAGEEGGEPPGLEHDEVPEREEDLGGQEAPSETRPEHGDAAPGRAP